MSQSPPNQKLLVMPPPAATRTSSTTTPNLVLVSQSSAPVNIPIIQKPYFRSVKGYVSNTSEVMSVCRTCYHGISDKESTKLFDTDKKEESEKLRQMLVEINPNIDLDLYRDPVICTKCVKQLSTSYEFKMKSVESEQRFNKWAEQRRGVHQDEVNLLIAVHSDETVTKEVSKRVDLDHDYAPAPPEPVKIRKRKKFCYKIALSGEAMAKRVCRSKDLKGPFLCEQCGDVIGSHRVYRRHLFLHFNKEKPQFYKCSRCNYRTESALGLKKHARRRQHYQVRDGERLCQVCGEVFRSSELFQEHVSSHTPEKTTKNEIEENEFQRIEKQLQSYFGESEEDSSVCLDVVKKEIVSVKELENVL